DAAVVREPAIRGPAHVYEQADRDVAALRPHRLVQAVLRAPAGSRIRERDAVGTYVDVAAVELASQPDALGTQTLESSPNLLDGARVPQQDSLHPSRISALHRELAHHRTCWMVRGEPEVPFRVRVARGLLELAREQGTPRRRIVGGQQLRR